MNKAVILLSGGMDSATLLFHMKSEIKAKSIYALSFIYGQKHSREMEMARWQANQAEVTEHQQIDISWFGQITKGGSALTDADIEIPDLNTLSEKERRQPPTYVPNRNMMLLSIAAAYAESVGSQDLFYGAQAQDEYGYWDCTVDFVSKINNVLSLNRNKPVTVHAPFAEKTKCEVVKLGLELGVDYDHTWSCYRGEDKPCGTCPSCVERQNAFEGMER